MKLVQDTFSGKCLRKPLQQGLLSHHGVKEKHQPLYQKLVLNMAEKEGFEPSRQLSHPTPLAGEPLRPLGYFSISRFWRRERDSNPRCLAASLVFKTSALNHSAISPQKTSGTIIAKSMRHVNDFLKIFRLEMKGEPGARAWYFSSQEAASTGTSGLTTSTNIVHAPLAGSVVMLHESGLWKKRVWN